MTYESVPTEIRQENALHSCPNYVVTTIYYVFARLLMTFSVVYYYKLNIHVPELVCIDRTLYANWTTH